MFVVKRTYFVLRKDVFTTSTISFKCKIITSAFTLCYSSSLGPSLGLQNFAKVSVHPFLSFKWCQHIASNIYTYLFPVLTLQLRLITCYNLLRLAKFQIFPALGCIFHFYPKLQFLMKIHNTFEYLMLDT